MKTLRFLPLLLISAACGDAREQARADSLQALTAEQLALTERLSAQKDSLTTVILDADAFVAQIDSQISRVRGMKSRRKREPLESPIEEQLRARKEMLDRVAAVVQRANRTADELAESRRRESELRGERDSLQSRLAEERAMIAFLDETIQRHTATILDLQTRVDSLLTETRTLGERHYRAYYVIGTEDQLLEKGILRREGGANLLVVRVGETLMPSRQFPPEHFTAIDQREVREIPVPDTTRRYRIVSRQSLAGAEVGSLDGSIFRGPIRVTDTERFWGSSRYLIIVQL